MKEVLWTAKAERSYNEVLDYLISNWTDKEYENFVLRTKKLLKTIQNNPLSFQKSDKYPHIRRAVLLEKISIYYSVDHNKINVLLFWDNRSNPESLKL